MIFAELQETNSETMLVITAVAPENSHEVTPTEVPDFTIFIDNSWTTHDYITPAIADITARAFTRDQIKLITESTEAPNHLEVQTNTTCEAARAGTQTHQTLILVTAEPQEKDNSLTVLCTKTRKSFKVFNQIELTDALCDLIMPLRQKTLVDIFLTVELESDEATLTPDCFVVRVAKEKNAYKLILNDLSSKGWHQFCFRITGRSSEIKLTFSFTDLILMRTIHGGILLQGKLN